MISPFFNTLVDVLGSVLTPNPPSLASFSKPWSLKNPSEVMLAVACSGLSDSGEDAKGKGTITVGGAGKRKKEERELVIISFTTLVPPTCFR